MKKWIILICIAPLVCVFVLVKNHYFSDNTSYKNASSKSGEQIREKVIEKKEKTSEDSSFNSVQATLKKGEKLLLDIDHQRAEREEKHNNEEYFEKMGRINFIKKEGRYRQLLDTWNLPDSDSKLALDSLRDLERDEVRLHVQSAVNKPRTLGSKWTTEQSLAYSKRQEKRKSVIHEQALQKLTEVIGSNKAKELAVLQRKLTDVELFEADYEMFMSKK
ncbi:MAG: hypothetical protein NTV80_19105 [Verrucomicrobia bacterium]|nr:hypothetical protein [Verrucomicrobiota bacterium]